ncbi:MAG: transketolase C-terminal domain-containing protein [Alphaproteobacteria bacterium]|nr:transketolase C-terminal domain-containing protein [Alphaproteobacteria bacterium]
MPRKSYAQAMLDAILAAFESDPTTRVIGPSFAQGRGAPETQEAFFKTYGARIMQPPISEGVTAALGAGAAMAGLRPFVNFGTSTFAFEAWNQIVNEAANAHFMSGGQVTVPVIYHMFAGIRGGGGVQHSQSPQSMYANCPGLKLVLPASPADIQGLIATAFRSPDPTVIINHTKLMGLEGDVPEGDVAIPFGQAEVKREGADVTLVATSLMVQRALDAADQLAGDGVKAEVVDPRTIVPLDRETIIASAAKTGRLVVVDEAAATCSIAAEIIASVAEAGVALTAPPVRVTRPDTPVGFSPALERAAEPNVEGIAGAIRRVMG